MSIEAAAKAAHDAESNKVMVQLEISNFADYPLKNPLTYPVQGAVSYPASPVLAGHREAMVMHKTNWFRGSYGTVSWEMAEGKRVVVMWSAPYNFDLHDNYLAVGFVDKDKHATSTADEMYYNSGNFTRGEYSDSANQIEYCDDKFCVVGTMGTSHHPQIHINLFPKSTDSLAYNVKAYMGDHDLTDVVG